MKAKLLWFVAGIAVAVAVTQWALPIVMHGVVRRELAGYFRDTPLSLPFHAFTPLAMKTFVSYAVPDLDLHLDSQALEGVRRAIEEKYALSLRAAREGMGSLEAMRDYMRDTGILTELGLSSESALAALEKIDPAIRWLEPRAGHSAYYPASAPPGPVRLPAEYEPIGAVLVAWPIYLTGNWGTLSEFIRQIVTEADAFILAPDAIWQAGAELFLSAKKVDLDRVRFIRLPIDDVWTRDYGPVTVLAGESETPVLIANPYVIPGQPYYKHDAEVAPGLGGVFDTPVYYLPAIVEGGNIITDGKGTILMFDSILYHNPDIPRPRLEGIVRDYYGGKRLLLFPSLEGEVTGHIDGIVKVLDDSTLMVTSTPEGHKWHETIENMAAELARTRSAAGTNYRVVRVPLPRTDADFQEWTYINSLTLNRKVIVPTYGGPEDETALKVYRESMPDHEIVGVNYRNYPVGAIHCQSKEIPAALAGRLGGHAGAGKKGGES